MVWSLIMATPKKDIIKASANYHKNKKERQVKLHDFKERILIKP